MPRLARQPAFSLSSDRIAGSHFAADRVSTATQLARTQLWSELPTLFGVVAVVLGALFL